MKGMASAGTKSKVYILLTIIYIIAVPCYTLPIDKNKYDNVFPDHMPLTDKNAIKDEIMNKTITTTVYTENISISVSNGTGNINADDNRKIKNNLTNFSNLHENGDKIIVSVKVTSSSGENHSEFVINSKRNNEENLRLGKELLQMKKEHHVTVGAVLMENNDTDANVNLSHSDVKNSDNGYDVYFPKVPESIGDGHDLEDTDQHDTKYFTSQEDSNADSTNYHFVVASPYPTSDYSKIEPSQGTNTGSNNGEKEQIPYQALIVINNSYKETSAQPRSISYNSMLQSVSEVKLWSDYKSYSSANDKIENKTDNQQRARSRSESNSFLDRKFGYDHNQDSNEHSIASKFFNKNLNHGKFNVTKSPQFTRKIIFNLDRLPYDLLNAPIQDRGSVSANSGFSSGSASMFSSATESNSLINNFGKSTTNNGKLQPINHNKESVNYLYTQIHPIVSQYKEKQTNDNPNNSEERHYKIFITPRPDNPDSTSYQYSKTSNNDVTSLENTVSPSYFTDPPRNHHINKPISDPDTKLNNLQEINTNKNQNYNPDDVDINTSPIDNDSHKVGFVIEGLNYRKYRIEEKTSEGFIVGEYGVVSNNDGSLRGVRYTADSNINPRLIQETLLKFLSL